eukprot:UC4_evm11s507
MCCWTGSDIAEPLRSINKGDELELLISSILPGGHSHFFLSVYDDHMHIASQRESKFDSSVLMNKLGNIKEVFEVFQDEGLLYSGGGVSMYSVDRKVQGRYDGKTSIPEDLEFDEFLGRLRRENYKGPNGDSFLFRFENVPQTRRPLRDFEQALFHLSGIPLSIHLYVSAEGSQVLEPHTDPYDVLVIQLTGEKKWRTCVPNSEVMSKKYNISRNLSQAELCMLQELSLGDVRGCTTYSIKESDKLDCNNFDMKAGDVLYMPKGVVHYAQTESESMHLTIGFHRWNMQWIDVFRGLINEFLAKEDIQAGIGTSQRKVENLKENFALKLDLVEWYAETANGVHLQESIPGWLLQCYRSSCEKCVEMCSSTLQKKNEEELIRLFFIHFELFDIWIRSSTIGTYLKLNRLDLLWAKAHIDWQVVLGSDEEGLRHIFRALGRKVQKYKDARNKISKPPKPQRHVMRQSSREKPKNNRPTLCDKQRFWSNECKGSSSSACIATYTTRRRGNGKSCREYCQMHGLYCGGSYPTEKENICSNSLIALKSSKAKKNCNVPFDSHVCKCTLGKNGTRIPGFVLRDKRRAFQDKTEETWSLCDDLYGWDTECIGSDPSRCEVLLNIRQKITCREYCEEQGTICETGWDDTAGKAVTEGSIVKYAGALPSTKWSSVVMFAPFR